MVNDIPEMDDVDPIVKKYIQVLAYSSVEIPDSVNVNLTLDQYKEFWKKRKN